MVVLWEGDLFQLVANNGMVWINRKGSDDVAPCSGSDDIVLDDDDADFAWELGKRDATGELRRLVETRLPSPDNR